METFLIIIKGFRQLPPAKTQSLDLIKIGIEITQDSLLASPSITSILQRHGTLYILSKIKTKQCSKTTNSKLNCCLTCHSSLSRKIINKIFSTMAMKIIFGKLVVVKVKRYFVKSIFVINPSRPDPGQREKFNLKFLFSHFFPVP